MPAETHRAGRQRLSLRDAPGLIAAVSPARPGPAGRPGRYMRLGSRSFVLPCEATVRRAAR